MLDAYSTRWTTTRVAPTHNAPFAGLAEPTPAASPTSSGPTSGAFAGAQQGVVLVLLGLGAVALWHGLRRKSVDDFFSGVESSTERRLRGTSTDTLYGQYLRATKSGDRQTAAATEAELRRRGKGVLPKGVK